MILKKFIKIIKNDNNVLNTSKLVSGTLIAQIITFIGITLKSRLYLPKDFGAYAVLTSITSIAMVFFSFGLNSAIVISNSNEDAKGICKMITFITRISCLLLFIIIAGLYPYVKLIPLNNNYYVYLLLLLLSVVLGNHLKIISAYINRLGKYNVLSLNPIIQSGVYLVVSVLLGLIGLTKYGLILGSLSGIVGSIIYMERNLEKNNYELSLHNIKYIFNKYKKFLKYQYPSAIFNTFSSQLPNLLIAKFFGENVLGCYTMSQRLLGMPVSLVGSAKGKIFLKEASDKKNKGEDLGGFLYKHIKTVVMFSAIPVCILLALGDILVPLLLGKNWSLAGKYVRILSVYYIFVFVMNSSLGLPAILSLQKTNMFVGFISFFLNMFVVFTSYRFFQNDIIMVTALAFVNSLIQIIFYYIMISETKMKANCYVRFMCCSIILILIVSYLIRNVVSIFL